MQTFREFAEKRLQHAKDILMARNAAEMRRRLECRSTALTKRCKHIFLEHAFYKKSITICSNTCQIVTQKLCVELSYRAIKTVSSRLALYASRF